MKLLKEMNDSVKSMKEKDMFQKYANAIKDGTITIDQVPEKYQDQVRELIGPQVGDLRRRIQQAQN